MENSIKHLIRSNIELEAQLQEVRSFNCNLCNMKSFDQDFKDAFEENKVTIVNKSTLLKKLQKELEKSLASRGEIQKEETVEENGIYL